MYKNLILNEVEGAINKAIQDKKLGSMEEYTKGTLNIILFNYINNLIYKNIFAVTFN